MEEREELQRLRRENKQLKLEREILRNRGLVCSGERVGSRSGFEFVKANQANYPVRLMCRVGLSPSGYYAWSGRAPSARSRANEALLLTMRGIHAATKQSDGRPRMYAELRDDGMLVNHKRVGRLMKLDGLNGITQLGGIEMRARRLTW
jgi:hypothetical protein